MVTAYRDALRAHQDLINRLNVYPVPDGDTGTNMALTIESVLMEVASGRRGRHGSDRRRHQPRLVDGGPWQLRGHPVADLAGPGGHGARPRRHRCPDARRRLWPGRPTAPTRPSSSRSRAPSSPWRRAAADGAAAAGPGADLVAGARGRPSGGRRGAGSDPRSAAGAEDGRGGRLRRRRSGPPVRRVPPRGRRPTPSPTLRRTSNRASPP